MSEEIFKTKWLSLIDELSKRPLDQKKKILQALSEKNIFKLKPKHTIEYQIEALEKSQEQSTDFERNLKQFEMTLNNQIIQKEVSQYSVLLKESVKKLFLISSF